MDVNTGLLLLSSQVNGYLFRIEHRGCVHLESTVTECGQFHKVSGLMTPAVVVTTEE